MKSGTKTGLRIAAWSTLALVGMGAAAGAASAVGGHSGGPGGAPGGGPGAGGPNLVHSIATVKLNGHFRKVADQRGTVTDVSAESITVTSADEYAATYAISSNTKVMKDWKSAAVSDLADGDTVMVHAVRRSGHYVAQFIADGNLQPPAGGHGPDGPGHPDGQSHPDGPAPAGTPTATA